MRPVVYDAGALIAADRGNNELFAALVDETQKAAIIPATPAGVLAQVWRDGARQARLARLLKSINVIPLDTETAKAAGELCGKAGTRDIVDASVVVIAAGLGALIATSDPGDISKLIDAYTPRPNIRIYVL